MDMHTKTIRAAVATLVEAALKTLRDVEIAPKIGSVPDNRRWWRHGTETFVGLNPRAWMMSETVTHYRWLDSMPEMRAVRQAFELNPILGPRIDAPLGTAWSRQPQQLGWMLVEHVIAPMVLKNETYGFDAALFDTTFEQFVVGLSAPEIHMVEFLPLNGFDCTDESVELPDGLVLRPMTDQEMSDAITRLAVPRASSATINNAQISRFHQWALTRTEPHLVVAGYATPESPTPSAFPALQEPATRLVTALRIVCGGSVVATRSMYAQASDEFPVVKGTSAMLSGFDPADEQRPTILTRDQIDTVLRIYQQLGEAQIKADKQLQVTIRRAVFAGSRSLDNDRLVDWMTAAESLFIKRAGITGHAKGKPLAQEAARILGGDAVLGMTSGQVETFMINAYQARNAEIHGDGDPHPLMLTLSGETVDSLNLMVADVERLMRRALVLTLLGSGFRSPQS